MNRRAAVGRVALILGSTLVGGEAFLSCKSKQAQVEKTISNQLMKLLDEIGETIVPATVQSPGAKAAGIGLFMKAIVEDCYTPEEQNTFFNGLVKFEEEVQKRFGNTFLEIDAVDKTDFLNGLAREDANNKDHQGLTSFFTMVKQLTVWGYFSSEIGATQALRFIEVPGRYEGCIDYKKGDRAWAI